MNSEKSIIIRIDISGKHKSMFEEIKQINNFSTNTDAFRYCIERAYSSASLKIQTETTEIINSLLKNDTIRSTYNIFNQETFIDQAISQFIQKLRIERGSLRSFTTRQNLTKEELNVAVELLDLLDSDTHTNSFGVTLEKLSEKLEWPISRVSVILQRFKKQDLIIEQIIHDKVHYYAPYPGE